MPNRYIVLPEAIVLRDPLTKEEFKSPDGKPEVWDFKTILNRLMGNPKWGESYANMRSQEAIEDAFENAKDGIVQIAEEDWNKLKDAAENPRYQHNGVMGAQVIGGLGIRPDVVRQLLPLLRPIVEAKAERPGQKPKE